MSENNIECSCEAQNDREPPKCPLCEFNGCENVKLNEIMNFVSEQVHEVHIDELCRQVRENLQEQLGVSMTFEQIKTHFLHHQCDQKVILNNVLRELIPLMGMARTNCVVMQENSSIVDPKSIATYLDTIKQVMCVYKHLGCLTKK